MISGRFLHSTLSYFTQIWADCPLHRPAFFRPAPNCLTSFPGSTPLSRWRLIGSGTDSYLVLLGLKTSNVLQAVRHRLQSEWLNGHSDTSEWLNGHSDTTSVNLYTTTVFVKFSTWSEKFVRVHKWLIVPYTQATLQHINMSSVRIGQNSGAMRKFSRCESFPSTAIAKDLNIFR